MKQVYFTVGDEFDSLWWKFYSSFVIFYFFIFQFSYIKYSFIEFKLLYVSIYYSHMIKDDYASFQNAFCSSYIIFRKYYFRYLLFSV
jgi:hypothetical protein